MTNEDGYFDYGRGAISLLGIGETSDLSRYEFGGWVPCCNVKCNTQFQLQQWFCGIIDDHGEDEDREPWQGEDTGEDELKFLCYECAKEALTDEAYDALRMFNYD